MQDSIEKDKAGTRDVAAVISQVLARDQAWLKFYRDTVDGLDVSDDALEKVKIRESQLAASAVEECRFMTRLWQGDLEGARKVLLDILDDTAVADAKLAGWHSLWIGAAYEADGDLETAIAHYKKARSRLSHWLNVPTRAAANPTGKTRARRQYWSRPSARLTGTDRKPSGTMPIRSCVLRGRF